MLCMASDLSFNPNGRVLWARSHHCIQRIRFRYDKKSACFNQHITFKIFDSANDLCFSIGCLAEKSVEKGLCMLE